LVPAHNISKRAKSKIPNKFTIGLGILIRNARIEAGINQTELARKTGINQAAISLIEAGKRSVSAEEIMLFSLALNKPVTYFYSIESTGYINQFG